MGVNVGRQVAGYCAADLVLHSDVQDRIGNISRKNTYRKVGQMHGVIGGTVALPMPIYGHMQLSVTDKEREDR